MPWWLWFGELQWTSLHQHMFTAKHQWFESWPELGYSTKSVQAEHQHCRQSSAVGVAESHLYILMMSRCKFLSKERGDGSSLFNLMKRGIMKCDLVTWFPQFSVSLCWMDSGSECLSICWNHAFPRNLLPQRIREKLWNGGGGIERVIWQLIKQ